MRAHNVVWNYVRPNVIGGGAPMMKTDRKSIDVTCSCGHRWNGARADFGNQAT
jgi:hypothetical protein